MDLIEAKIAEIKNLNLIHIFAIDSLLKNNPDKYVGAQVVYDETKTFSLHYKSKYFGTFIKRILVRYNKEKGKRTITLLGDLTEKLVKDSFFTILKEKKETTQNFSILVNSKSNELKVYQRYLEKTLKNILKSIKNFEGVNINSINGFNYKYVVDYSVGNVKKQLFMLIFVKHDGSLDFKITNIEDEIVDISGTIEDYLTTIKVIWYDDIRKLQGVELYNSKEKIIEEKLYKEKDLIISREYTDTLLDEDESVISFYLKLCDLNTLKNILKIDDNSYLLSDDNILKQDNKTSGIFYNTISCKINIFDNQVIIKNIQKNGLSKHNNRIKVVLEEIVNDFILRKIVIENEFYLLIEKRNRNNGTISYNYSVIKLNSDIDLNIPFEIQYKKDIKQELKNLDSAKQYIKNLKGGK